MLRHRSGHVIIISRRQTSKNAHCASCHRVLTKGELVEASQMGCRYTSKTIYFCTQCMNKPLLVYQPHLTRRKKVAAMQI